MVAEGKLTEANKFEGLVQAIDAAVQSKVKEKEEEKLKKKLDEYEAYWGHPMDAKDAAKLKAEVCKNSLEYAQKKQQQQELQEDQDAEDAPIPGMAG